MFVFVEPVQLHVSCVSPKIEQPTPSLHIVVMPVFWNKAIVAYVDYQIVRLEGLFVPVSSGISAGAVVLMLGGQFGCGPSSAD